METFAQKVQVLVEGGQDLAAAQAAQIAEAHVILLADGMVADDFAGVPVPELLEMADGVAKKNAELEAKKGNGDAATRVLTDTPKFLCHEICFQELRGTSTETGFRAQIYDKDWNPFMITAENKFVLAPANAKLDQEEQERNGKMMNIRIFVDPKTNKKLGEAIVVNMFSSKGSGIEGTADTFRRKRGAEDVSYEELVYRTHIQVGGVWINEKGANGKNNGFANLQTADQNGEAYRANLVSVYFPEAIRKAKPFKG